MGKVGVGGVALSVAPPAPAPARVDTSDAVGDVGAVWRLHPRVAANRTRENAVSVDRDIRWLRDITASQLRVVELDAPLNTNDMSFMSFVFLERRYDQTKAAIRNAPEA